MTTFDRDTGEWTLTAEITFTAYIKVNGVTDDIEAHSEAEKAIVASFADKVHTMEVGGEDWPIHPSVTLHDPYGVSVEVV